MRGARLSSSNVSTAASRSDVIVSGGDAAHTIFIVVENASGHRIAGPFRILPAFVHAHFEVGAALVVEGVGTFLGDDFPAVSPDFKKAVGLVGPLDVKDPVGPDAGAVRAEIVVLSAAVFPLSALERVGFGVPAVDHRPATPCRVEGDDGVASVLAQIEVGPAVPLGHDLPDGIGNVVFREVDAEAIPVFAADLDLGTPGMVADFGTVGYLVAEPVQGRPHGVSARTGVFGRNSRGIP